MLNSSAKSVAIMKTRKYLSDGLFIILIIDIVFFVSDYLDSNLNTANTVIYISEIIVLSVIWGVMRSVLLRLAKEADSNSQDMNQGK